MGLGPGVRCLGFPTSVLGNTWQKKKFTKDMATQSSEAAASSKGVLGCGDVC